MNNSTSYSEYKPSTDPQQFNVFSDEFLPGSNEFTNSRANNSNPEMPKFLYSFKPLNFPANPANYDRYTFGTSPNQRQWMAYNGTWREIGEGFAFPYVKTKQEVWLNGFEDFYWKARPNYTGDNAYVKNSSAWRYGNVVGTSVTPGYSNVAGGNWHPVDWLYPNSLAEGVGYTIQTGVKSFNYGAIRELTEVIFEEAEEDNQQNFVASYDTTASANPLLKKLTLEEYDNRFLLGTITSNAFNVADQSIDLPSSIGDKLKNNDRFYLVPKFWYFENNEGKPITVPVRIVYNSGQFNAFSSNDSAAYELDSVFHSDFNRQGYSRLTYRSTKGWLNNIGQMPPLNILLKKISANKYGNKKKIEKIKWNYFRRYYNTNFLNYVGNYSYEQSFFDNPIETEVPWLVSSGANMVFNVYKVKVKNTWKTGDEVSLIPARASGERLWSDLWGGSDIFNYFSWLDSRYVNLSTNEITIQSEGYVEDFYTGDEVEIVGASNIIQGGRFAVVHQIFKTNQVLTPYPSLDCYYCNLNLSDGTTFLLTGQNDVALNGFYYVLFESPVRVVQRRQPNYNRDPYSSSYFGNANGIAAVPNTSGHVDSNIEAWRIDLYICVVKDFSEGHDGRLTVYKQVQPWNGYEGLPGVELTIGAKQRKRLESFYGNYQDGYVAGPMVSYESGYLPSANNGWYAGSRFFASTFTELPDGLEDGGRYHLIRNGNKVKLASSYEDAIAGNEVPLKSIGKGALLIYRAKSNNTKTISTIKTVDGQEVETVLPPSQSCFLIKKDSGFFQLAETKAKALSGEALRLKVEPNTFLKLEKTTTETQTQKYIWNPQETTALEPLNQKTGQVYYSRVQYWQPQYGNVLGFDNRYPSDVLCTDFDQGYTLSVVQNKPSYGPTSFLDSGSTAGGGYTFTSSGLFTGLGGEIEGQYFDKDGNINTEQPHQILYPATLPEPVLHSITYDGIELERVVDVPAHWSDLKRTYIYNDDKNYYLRDYVVSTYKVTSASKKAVADNMITKTLANLSTMKIDLDRNTTLNNISQIATGGTQNTADAFSRFNVLVNYINRNHDYSTGYFLSEGSGFGVDSYESFFGGVSVSSTFKIVLNLSNNVINTHYEYDYSKPIYQQYWPPPQYSMKTSQTISTGQGSQQQDVMKITFKIIAMLAVGKKNDEQLLNVVALPFTVDEKSYYNDNFFLANYSQGYLNPGESKLYKKTGGTFVAINNPSTNWLPNEINLTEPYLFFDKTKSFKLDFSSQVTQTWRKHTLTADPIPDPDNLTGEKYNRLSQLTSQDYQQNPSDFSGPVICSYKEAKKTWSSSTLSTNGIPFKIEVVPRTTLTFTGTYYSGATAYANTNLVLYPSPQHSIKVFSSPNEYKEFTFSTINKMTTFDPLDATYVTVVAGENQTRKYSSNYYFKTGRAIPLLSDAITKEAGVSSGAALSSSFSAVNGYSPNANSYNPGVPNNGYELIISEDTKTGTVPVKDDIFNIPWGSISSLSSTWVEYWNVEGTQRLNDLFFYYGYVFRNKPSIEIVTLNGVGAEVEFYFGEGNHDIGLYTTTVPGFKYYSTSNIINKSGRYYYCSTNYTQQNSTNSDYVKIVGTAYKTGYNNYTEVPCQIRFGFTTSFFSGFPTSRSPTVQQYKDAYEYFVSSRNNYYWSNFSAPTSYPFLAKGVDNFTFMPGCSAPITISHLTKVSIQ